MKPNGNNIWRWRKIDILFVIGIAVIVYGAVRLNAPVMIVGAGVAGLPLTTRGDKS